MILSDGEIWELIKDNIIVFTPPLEADQVKSSAIDLRLGYSFTVYPYDVSHLPEAVRSILSQTVDLRDEATTQQFILAMRNAYTKTLKDRDSINIPPRSFLLAETLEDFNLPEDIAGRIEGRSTYARLGLTVHQTAPSVHPGWSGQLTLEMVNNGPFTYKLYPRMRLCQLILERLGKPIQSPDRSTWENAHYDQS